MSEFKFTEDWFSLTKFWNDFQLDREKEIHILEIGSFEGKSTLWFIDNFLKNPKSSITCIDPWLNYTQNNDTFNSYFQENNEWNFKDLKTKDKFLYNIVQSNKSNQVKIIQDFSHFQLPNLINNKLSYDIIFIDGNHTAPFVLTDSVMSWYLLKTGGYMVFDDYEWNLHLDESLTPKLAIDSFNRIFTDYIEEVYNGYVKVIRKIK